MTISYHKGNIFDSKAHYIVIPINCHGVFGAGLAKEFQVRFPTPYNKFIREVNRKDITLYPGCTYTRYPFIYATTKGHWKFPSNMDWIVNILYEFKENQNASVALPPLGCGLGGLDKSEFYTVAKWSLSDKPNNFELWDNV